MTITAGTAHNSNTGIMVSFCAYATLTGSGRPESLLESVLLLGADLRGLHRGLRLDLRLVNAVAYDGRGRGGRLAVDDGALLGGRVAHDVEFGGARGLRAQSEGGKRAA